MREIIRKDLAANGFPSPGLRSFAYATLFSPGFALALRSRLIIGFYRKGRIGKMLSKLVWRSTVRNYGCYIDPTAVVGHGIRFPHPVGIVIGGGSRVGCDVTIYQNVTIGRLRHDESEIGYVADRCVLYAGAMVLGALELEPGSVIGAGKIVRHSRVRD